MTRLDRTKKNLLKILVAGCGLLCAQASWSAGELPSKVAFSPKKPIKFSMRIETSDPVALDSCERLFKFFKVDYKLVGKSSANDPPWVIETGKEYAPPFTDPDRLVRTLRGTPCGTSGDFSWTVSQEATIHEAAKPKKH